MPRTKMINEIRIWCQKAKDFDVAHLNPKEHLPPRRDSIYRLKNIYESKEKLIIELDSKRKLTITGNIRRTTLRIDYRIFMKTRAS